MMDIINKEKYHVYEYNKHNWGNYITKKTTGKSSALHSGEYYISLAQKLLGTNYNMSQEFSKFREATSQERAWLDACIAAGIFIPLEQLKLEVEYEIW